MNCQKCDKGKILSAKVYYDEKIGLNVDGVGKFVEQKTDTCPCCGGAWESCQKCSLEQKAIDNLIAQGVAAYKEGRKEEARKTFITLVKQNQNEERAWSLMYQVSNNDQERIHCLKQVLRINPNNERAKEMLNSLTGKDFPFDSETKVASPAKLENQSTNEKTPLAPIPQPQKIIAPQKPTTPKKKNNLIIGGIVAFFVIICLCSILSSGSGGGGGGGGSNIETDHSTMASVICKEIVKNSLISPSTADFPWPTSGDVRRFQNNIYEVRSYVDAQNGFGATIRNNYYCQLQYTGRDIEDEDVNVNNWHLLDFSMSP